MRLLVTGGNGFIGRIVCALAVEAGIPTRSIARQGRPPVSESWADSVEWHTGSVFDKDQLASAMEGVSAVAHCVGILREQGPDTFKRCNGDAAILTGEAAKAAKADTFLFISAAEKPPWVHEEYLSSKRRAEVALGKIGMRLVVVRPGLVYGPERPLSVLAARVLEAARAISASTLVRSNAPMRARLLGKAIIKALVDPSVTGIVEAPRLRELAAGYS